MTKATVYFDGRVIWEVSDASPSARQTCIRSFVF